MAASEQWCIALLLKYTTISVKKKHKKKMMFVNPTYSKLKKVFILSLFYLFKHHKIKSESSAKHYSDIIGLSLNKSKTDSMKPNESIA